MTPAPKTNGLTTPQSTIDREKEALKLSKVVSIDECERFDFVFDDTDFNGNACRNSIRHAEGILINPRWATYKFNYKEQKIEAVPGTGLTIEEFKNLVIDEEVMRDGILFIWVEKELIQPIISFFDIPTLTNIFDRESHINKKDLYTKT